MVCRQAQIREVVGACTAMHGRAWSAMGGRAWRSMRGRALLFERFLPSAGFVSLRGIFKKCLEIDSWPLVFLLKSLYFHT